MFSDCTELIIAPELPALSVNSQSYSSMFSNCTKLTIPPELPATSLSLGCYSGMFTGCSSLVIPPELPATTLKEYCYNSMFSGCTSLTTTPILSASTITLGCYLRMFSGCKNIRQTAPILFVSNGGGTDITYGDCEGMFLGCENLQYISVKFESWKSRGRYDATYGQMEVQSATENWVKGVAPNGTFVCPDKLSKQFDVNHIPEGWTVKSIDDLEAYNINIPQESRKYIIIPYTTEIEAGTEMSFYVKDRTSEGLTFDGVTVVGSGQNSISLTNNNNVYTFTMPAEDVTISVTYSSTPINYTITTDDYSIADKTEASEGETVNVTFVNRDGYNLTSATYNGTALTITNGAAQFTMPAANVTIETTHTPIEYKITAGEFITVDKTKATINDQVSFTVADRANDGYQLDKVLVNNTEFTGTSFNMADYLKDVTITAQYSKIAYTITTDDYSSTNKTTANVGDVIDVTFKNRDGYNLTSATYNGTALTITNSATQFTMPAANVSIVTTYTKIDYTITADQYSTPNKTTANVGDEITVTFTNRDGYNLTSATYNGTALTITNNTSSFTMPAANVTIATTYTKVDYTITADQYSTPNKNKANVGDEITVTFANRDGYNLTSATYNGAALTITNGTSSFTMPAANVTIATTYTTVDYTITADQYSTPNKTIANVGDEITVSFANRDGYNLTSATYNGTALTITNNSASFTMPAANVTIATTYTPIEYNITVGEYVTANKAKATINDQVSFTVADRTADGYQLNKVLINNTEFSGTTFNMADYLTDVTITAVYSKIGYTITSDAYSTPNKTTANVGDEITVTFANRDGYSLTSATYNVTALNITNNTASFTMPAANVTIATTYTPIEYNVTAGEYVTANKNKATISDQVSFTVADRTADGYQLNKVLINNTEFSGRSFNMADYLKDVTITAVYSKINYSIITDEHSSADKNSANVGDKINVNFSNIQGHYIFRAVCNGNELIVEDYGSWFTMPAENAYVATSYLPIEYNITAGEYVTANKAKATINDQVSFTVADRTADDYQLDKVLINNTEFSGTSFYMADYLADVTITAVY
ncbi:MAG: hypothetical protein IKB95_07265, partial [Bacteroidales bacterium]|nr:hypothetical protein [Bacteroidales bacterium]